MPGSLLTQTARTALVIKQLFLAKPILTYTHTVPGYKWTGLLFARYKANILFIIMRYNILLDCVLFYVRLLSKHYIKICIVRMCLNNNIFRLKTNCCFANTMLCHMFDFLSLL